MKRNNNEGKEQAKNSFHHRRAVDSIGTEVMGAWLLQEGSALYKPLKTDIIPSLTPKQAQSIVPQWIEP
ncbi:MAG: hypothetical protein K6A68_16080 [Clostridiales bacterium]|nr:hypothetical protein [Clostridiales bacterium]